MLLWLVALHATRPSRVICFRCDFAVRVVATGARRFRSRRMLAIRRHPGRPIKQRQHYEYQQHRNHCRDKNYRLCPFAHVVHLIIKPPLRVSWRINQSLTTDVSAIPSFYKLPSLWIFSIREAYTVAWHVRPNPPERLLFLFCLSMPDRLRQNLRHEPGSFQA